MEKETKIINWEQDFFVGHRIVSVVKRVAFVSDRVSYSSERSLMLHHCSESACTKWREKWWNKKQFVSGIRTGFSFLSTT